MSRPRVGLFGDFGTDVYWKGTVRGLSAEAPIPVVKDVVPVVLPGMAGNVQSLLEQLGMEVIPIYGASPRVLPIKNRLVTEDGIQLARWDCQDSCRPPTDEELSEFSSLPTVDAVVVCDYGKGGVDDRVLEFLTNEETGYKNRFEKARIYVDTKSDPIVWLGEPAILFPNDKEYLAHKSTYDWLERVIHKKSEAGVELLSYGRVVDKHRAEALAVRNVCGAGDAILAATVRWCITATIPSAPDMLGYISFRAAAYVSSPWWERSLA